MEALDEEYAAAIQRAVDAFDDKVGSSDINDMPTLCGALRMIGFRWLGASMKPQYCAFFSLVRNPVLWTLMVSASSQRLKGQSGAVPGAEDLFGLNRA